MKYMIALLITPLLLGACSFSKKPNVQSDSENIKIVIMDKQNDPTLDQLFNSRTRNEQIEFINRSSNTQLTQLKDQDGNGLLDLIAKNMDYELANILEKKGYSPFFFNKSESLSFLNAYQEREILKIDQAIAQGTFELSLITTKNYPKETCERFFQQLMNMRTISNSSSHKIDSDQLENSIQKVLNSDICRSILKSLDDRKKNAFLSDEFIYQYNNDFSDLTLISTLLFVLDIKDKSIQDADPQIFLDRKKDCISPFQLKSWQKFITTSLLRHRNYDLRLYDCDDANEITGNPYPGACLDPEAVKSIESHNIRVNKEINDNILHSEEVTCKK
ncbi:hypothetical protein [Bdellovibrio svalbardensis]|uniref:Lipoprotein n=1 Tax=Bdellovibrio svalbardensis TaxID=2972972 RepID=A0ABT6DGD0_9BACT|nr:hypothetical protein [Bdellovibrio svalbardensis]MDG0815871.1 hypothetical protein [Bdellovibrio svalbardensis]